MRLSFYSGLALAMIAADNAKAASSSLEAEISSEEEANGVGNFALDNAMSQIKASVDSDADAAATAETDADAWSEIDSAVESEGFSESELGSASEGESESDEDMALA